MTRTLPLVLCLVSCLLLTPRAQAEPTPAARVVTHDVTVRFDPPRHRLLARDVMAVSAPRAGAVTFRLAPALAISAVEVAGEPVPIPARAESGAFELMLPAGASEVVLAYAGAVHDEVEEADDLGWVAGDDTTGVIHARGIFLSPASGWIPTPADDPLARTSLTTYVPAPLLVVTQGKVPVRSQVTAPADFAAGDEVVPTAAAEGQVLNVARHEAEIPTDGVSLSAGRYAVRAREVGGLTIAAYFFAGSDADGNATRRIGGLPLETAQDLWLDSLAGTVARYADLLGDYPHSRFDIVENFFQSGYGMPGYTLLGDKVIDYVTLKAHRAGGRIPAGYLDHEYVHGWYGNGVLVDYETGNWCEAITTYYANYLAVELEEGADAARDYRRGVLEKFCIRVKGAKDYPLRAFKTKQEDADNDVGYGKGSLLIHMIRRRLDEVGGDGTFFHLVRDFTQAHIGQIVSWDDWLAAFAAHPGVDEMALAQWRALLDRRGLPQYAFEDVAATRVDDELVGVDAVITQVGTAVPWPGWVLLAEPGGLELDVDLGDGRAKVALALPAPDEAATAAEREVALDPDFDQLRRIPEAELPHCLNRTLEHGGDGIVMVTDDLVPLNQLAEQLVRTKGFRMVQVGYPIERHHGPAIVLSALREPSPDVTAYGQRLKDKRASLLWSTSWRGWPRTFYVAASADAAMRAGYVPFYGWDTWILFEGGRPLLRKTERPPATSTTRDVRPGLEGAAARIRERVDALAARPRAPKPGRNPALSDDLFAALDMEAAFPPQPAQADRGQFEILGGWRAPTPRLRYSSGARQGGIAHHHCRALCWSGSARTRGWMASRGEERAVAAVHVGGQDPSELYAASRAFGDLGALIWVVNAAQWATFAPWLDQPDDLTDTSKALLAKPGRRGAIRPQPELTTWIAGRRARGGLPNPEPLDFPVLMVRDEVLPRFGTEGVLRLAALEEWAVDVTVEQDRLPCQNVVAWLPPTGVGAPAGPPQVIVLTAHYDTPPTHTRGGRSVRYPGADDNASGLACLQEVARGLRQVWGTAPRKLGLVIAFPDAEEFGLQGSQRLVEDLTRHFDVRGVINVDSIGRAASKPTHVIGTTHYPHLATPVREALAAAGLEIGKNIDRFAYPHGSDHWSFHEAGIPAITLWASDYETMNTQHDTPDKVEPVGIARIAAALRTLVLGDLTRLCPAPR